MPTEFPAIGKLKALNVYELYEDYSSQLAGSVNHIYIYI